MTSGNTNSIKDTPGRSPLDSWFSKQFEAIALPWLLHQSESIMAMECGTLLLRDVKTGEKQQYSWGGDATPPPDHFHIALERAVQEQKGVVLTISSRNDNGEPTKSIHISYPVTLEKGLVLQAAFELRPSGEEQLKSGMQQLQWGLRWLQHSEFANYLQRSDQEQETRAVFAKGTNLLLSFLRNTDLKDSANSFCQNLVDYLGCERVTLGLLKREKISIIGFASTLKHDGKKNLKNSPDVQRSLIELSHEAIDQLRFIHFPLPPNHPPVVTRQHKKHCEQYNCGSIITIPLYDKEERPVGGIVAESDADKTLNENSAAFIETVAQLAGPILAAKLIRDDGWTTFSLQKIRQQVQLLCSTKKAKLLSYLLLCCFCLFILFGKTEFQVLVDVKLSGTLQRSIVAPYQGFVSQAKHRAGDQVEAGDLLASLDTSDLTLEQVKWSSKKNESDLEYRKAVAENVTARAKIILEQKKQAQTQLSLLKLQKERAHIKAPFSGLIVKGDLSQSIGAPVETGQILFEMVPNDGFRVLAQVDEKDIRFIAEKMQGSLVLNSLPKKTFEFKVRKITPVSQVTKGRNSFQVEGKLLTHSDRLRPGMSGYGKISVGRKNRLWQWSRSFRDQIRIWSYRFWG